MEKTGKEAVARRSDYWKGALYFILAGLIIWAFFNGYRLAKEWNYYKISNVRTTEFSDYEYYFTYGQYNQMVSGANVNQWLGRKPVTDAGGHEAFARYYEAAFYCHMYEEQGMEEEAEAMRNIMNENKENMDRFLFLQTAEDVDKVYRITNQHK